jgi:K+-transporting ATPase ATPase C chain
MKKILASLKTAAIGFAILTLICGIFYTGLVTGLANLLFPDRSNGSILSVMSNDGTIVSYGSALLAQEFSRPEYLIGRPAGGPTNLSRVSGEERDLIASRTAWWRSFDPENTAAVPSDLVTASASGADPNISPEAAEYQVTRIAKARGMEESEVRAIIARFTTGRFLGFIGEPAVCVLKVNLALDGK